MSGFLSSFNKTNKANDVIENISASTTTTANNMRFTIGPIASPGDSDFAQWVAAMKMVAQLPGGIPPEFRRRLWVTMAERHLESTGVDWSQVEKTCFGDWSQRADDELGVQIVKDLHRTGCSLFCGDEGQQNQALLKKVLIAYARWNKSVGYCQGFNMLAALILQVTDRCAGDALKLMIYLIEGVLPDSYFADSLRGLSVDMAVFRELLRSKLPRLAKHLDLLQNAAKDGARSYEPPLTNVFTMQWFLTLFCNCLPQPTVLRVWDLIFLEGNAVLLRTALAIWQKLAQRILAVRTADEFYCAMGALTRQLLESDLIDANTLIKAVVAIGPIAELKSLREHYLYNITPWGVAAPTSAKPPTSGSHAKMDIGALKQQYVKLRQRQRQAHVIFTSAVTGAGRPPPAAPVMNHLLVGKRSLGPSKRAGPPKGSVPPARQLHPSTLHWKDAAPGAAHPPTTATAPSCSSSSSSDTELCDEDDVQSSEEDLEEIKTTTDVTDNDKLFLATTSSSPKVASDSEDGDEFEQFLADRLRGDQATRRNSELALQIIQENSLILHRIMQCQSRLSPSPPNKDPLLSEDFIATTRSDSMDSNKSPIKIEYESELSDVNNPIKITIENDFDSPLQEIKEGDFDQKLELISPLLPIRDTELSSTNDDSENLIQQPIKNSDSEMQPIKYSFDSLIEDDGSLTDTNQFSSRLRSLLEKSKSLDEKYNFMLNKDKLMPPTLHESKSEEPLTLDKDNKKSNQLIEENLHLLKTYSANKITSLSRKLFQENVCLLESISNKTDSIEVATSQNDDLTANDDNFCDKFVIDSKSDNATDDFIESISASTSENLSIIDASNSSKSPNKSPNQETFNPFPISINSRQNKEVAVKLGLYKK